MDYKAAQYILGLSESSTEQEIRKAFRKLAHKYHPDRDGGDKQKFQELVAARDVLTKKTTIDDSVVASEKSGISVSLNVELEDVMYGNEYHATMHSGVEFTIQIQRGINHGAVIRGIVNNTPITVTVIVPTLQDNFTVNGKNLYTEVEISVLDSILGVDVEIPYFRGTKLRVSVPKGVRDGASVRLPYKGLPHTSPDLLSGHLYCKVNVVKKEYSGIVLSLLKLARKLS